MVVPGGVVEWLMAPVLKTGEVKASVGSNPTPSASIRAKDLRPELGSGQVSGRSSTVSPLAEFRPIREYSGTDLGPD